MPFFCRKLFGVCRSRIQLYNQGIRPAKYRIRPSTACRFYNRQPNRQSYRYLHRLKQALHIIAKMSVFVPERKDCPRILTALQGVFRTWYEQEPSYSKEGYDSRTSYLKIRLRQFARRLCRNAGTKASNKHDYTALPAHRRR